MAETQTGVRVELAREGVANVATGLPVLDHLIGELARTARFKLSLEVAPGSTDEAVAAAGRALGAALGERLAANAGIGWALAPADEALASAALERDPQPRLVTNVDFSGQRVGGLATDVARSRRRPKPARAARRGHRPAARALGDLQGGRRRARSGLPSRPRRQGGLVSKDVVRTEAAPAPFQGAPYSQAIKAGGFVFVSGQLPLLPGHTELMGGEIGPQTEQVFANLRAILEEAGSSLDKLVKTTVFLQNLGDFAGMNEVYAKHVGSAPPARSTVEVAKLPSGALVEIEAIALF
jgi:2-iminobutanoate/2-iminopropanoate deaminase